VTRPPATVDSLWTALRSAHGVGRRRPPTTCPPPPWTTARMHSRLTTAAWKTARMHSPFPTLPRAPRPSSSISLFLFPGPAPAQAQESAGACIPLCEHPASLMPLAQGRVIVPQAPPSSRPTTPRSAPQTRAAQISTSSRSGQPPCSYGCSGQPKRGLWPQKARAHSPSGLGADLAAILGAFLSANRSG
jgi:hypothetical protein